MDARGWMIIAVGVAAAIQDLRTREISNWTCGLAVAGGLTVHSFQRGLGGFGHSILGMLIGFAVFLVFYILGGMGGGDVKLMAGFGALLGSGQILHAAFLTALLGGVMALLVVAGRALRNRKRADGDAAGKAAESIPYAPAIALGAWLALVTEI
jgi:prepilin peptidase CpaA